MELHLGFVYGISDEDTLYFASAALQANYFSSFFSQSIEVSDFYYPPFYADGIKVDASEVPFGSQLNYLWFEYEGRRYYYFIERIDYLSENVTLLSIRMDTVQTYMFDIYVNSMVVERRFIDRWNADGTINRDYIRENFSEADYVTMEFKVYGSVHDFQFKNLSTPSSEFDIPYAVAKSTDGGGFSNNLMYYDNDDIENLESEGFMVRYMDEGSNLGWQTEQFIDLVCPLVNDPGASYTFNAGDGRGTHGMQNGPIYNQALTLDAITGGTGTFAVYLFPFNPYANTFTETTIEDPSLYHANLSINDPSSQWVGASTTDERGDYNYAACLRLQRVPESTTPVQTVGNACYWSEMSLPYLRNSLLGQPYSSNCLPVMIDENYESYEWGEPSEMTALPLFEMNRLEYHIDYALSPIDGFRYAWMQISTWVEAELFLFNDPGRTLVSYQPYTYDLKTDAWRDYLSYNKMSLMMTPAKIMAEVSSYGLSKAALAQSDWSARQAQKAKSSLGGYTRWGNEAGAKKARALRKHYLREASDWSSAADRIAQSGKGAGRDALSMLEDMGNAYYTPDKVTYQGNGLSMISFNVIYPRFVHRRVADYEACALSYHRNGYKVCEAYVSGDFAGTNLWDKFLNRYYFNVIKCSSADIGLLCLNSEEIVGDIRRRLLDGIRYWGSRNITGLIGSYYQYDNIELSAL